MTLASILEVADAVLYEGYLLYPYRSTSSKNQSRWQFGVLGPPGASGAGVGEPPEMHAECLVRAGDGAVAVHLRFLQLQARTVEAFDPSVPGWYRTVDELKTPVQTFVTWDEAVEQNIDVGRFELGGLAESVECPIEVAGGEAFEPIDVDGVEVGRVIRQRWPLRASVTLSTTPVDDSVVRLSIHVTNCAPETTDRHEATRTSLLGAHLVLESERAPFVSLLEPPEALQAAALACSNVRCWPVLAGDEGSSDAVLVSPIILYDYPQVAPESAGSLFDSTEIDEILTLRVMTLTEEEKAAARATDPAAAAIIDRCDAMTPEELQQLHGILRDPRSEPGWPQGAGAPDGTSELEGQLPFGDPDAFTTDIPSFVTPADDREHHGTVGLPWWDPGIDASVSPTSDVVVISGVAVSKGSAVRLHPSRAADAQDLFFANEPATVTAIFVDVDGGTHVAVVLDNDPAADLHEWYGRYLYFSPDEIEPLGDPPSGEEPSTASSANARTSGMTSQEM